MNVKIIIEMLKNVEELNKKKLFYYIYLGKIV